MCTNNDAHGFTLSLRKVFLLFQLFIGNAEFYVGQMEYVSDNDSTNLGVILGSCAGALVAVVIAVALVIVCCKSRRLRDCVLRKKTNSSTEETGAIINEGFLNAMKLPQLKKCRDTVLVGRVQVGNGKTCIIGGSDQDLSPQQLSDEYLTPSGKQMNGLTSEYLTPQGKPQADTTDSYLAPDVKPVTDSTVSCLASDGNKQ